MAAPRLILGILLFSFKILDFETVVGSEVYLNGTSESGNAEQNVAGRSKRSNLLTNSVPGSLGGSGSGSIEGLLASCQLTNLLLYQLLQQQSPNIGLLGPALGLNVASGQSNVAAQQQPLPAAAGLINNFLFPPPKLTTYVSTSTFTVQTTSSTVITIPLLFGNKPSPTTITRTKIYDITTSEIQTITATVEPSTVVTPSTTTVVIEATKTQHGAGQGHFTPMAFQAQHELSREVENDIDVLQENANYATPFLNYQTNPVEEQLANPGYAEKGALRARRKNQSPTAATAPSKPSRIAVRKVLKANPGTGPSGNGAKFETERTPAYRYGGVDSYGTKNFKSAAREFKQSPRDFSQESYYSEQSRGRRPAQKQSTYQSEYKEQQSSYEHDYYVRRLKRRGDALVDMDHDESSLSREFLLEPSFVPENTSPAPFSNFQNELHCPPPKEITVTKTVTKFVNPTPAGSAPFGAETAPAPTRTNWQPPADSRLRTGRKFTPTRASTYETPQQINNAVTKVPTPPNSRIPSDKPTRGRNRVNVQTFENNFDAVKNLAPTAQAPPPAVPRSRGRGDILNKARNTPVPTAASEADEGRGRQRRKQRQRQPLEQSDN